MLDTLRYVALSLIRDKGILIWALAFPIVLSTCFIFMFGGLDKIDSIEPVPVAVVADENYDGAEALKAFIDAVGNGDEGGSEVMLDVTEVESAEEAERLMAETADAEHPLVGYITADAKGMPDVHARNITASVSMEKANLSVLVAMMDVFASKSALAEEVLSDNPQLFADPLFVKGLFEVQDLTERVSLTLNPPKESVRYYFALLGMAALFGAEAGLLATLRLLPNMGPLGARREVGGVPHMAALAGTLLASWLVSFVCLVAAYLYIRFVAGVDFAGRDAGCIAAIGASSLMATSLGALLGSIPKIPNEAKTGVLTAVTCLCALFAGLYGQPTMRLADSVAKAFPPSQVINPAAQISDTFFSLMYYDSLSPFAAHMGILLATAALLFAVSAVNLRRRRYASL